MGFLAYVYYECIIINADLRLFIDGRELPGDGSARFSITDITTNYRLYCIFLSRVVGTTPEVYVNWYLGEQQIDIQNSGHRSSYLGWSSVVYLISSGYQYYALIRDSNSTASEGVFSCRRGRGNRIYSSVSVGVYYPSK